MDKDTSVDSAVLEEDEPPALSAEEMREIAIAANEHSADARVVDGLGSCE